MNLGALRFVTLFGHGPNVPGNDTSYIVDGAHAVPARGPAGGSRRGRGELEPRAHGRAARGWRAHAARASGPSGPAGSPLWGHGLTLTPADLEPIEREAAGTMVMVSGACNSGLFAEGRAMRVLRRAPRRRRVGMPAVARGARDVGRLLAPFLSRRDGRGRARETRPPTGRRCTTRTGTRRRGSRIIS